MPRMMVRTAEEEFLRHNRRGRVAVGTTAPRADVDGERRQQPPLRLLQQDAFAREDDAARPALPTLATAGDVRELVQYLKKRPEGVSVMEAVGDVRRRVFEPRKIVAYELWGLVRRRHDRLLLTPLGREFARRLAPGAESFRRLLRRTAAYHAALGWMRRHVADTVTHTEVVAFWQQLMGEGAGGEAGEGHVVCFFHLCQAAQLGAATVGKRGQPARLRIDREELEDYFDGGAETDAEGGADDVAAPARRRTREGDDDAQPPSSGSGLQVFVSAGKSSALAAQVETTLALAGNACEVCRRAEPDSLLPSDEEARAMRACDAAVFIVSADDCRHGADAEPALGQSLLVQIAACVVLYEGRVALLWESGVAPPPPLGGLRRFAFAGDVLTWELGIGLLKAAKDFQCARDARTATPTAT